MCSLAVGSVWRTAWCSPAVSLKPARGRSRAEESRQLGLGRDRQGPVAPVRSLAAAGSGRPSARAGQRQGQVGTARDLHGHGRPRPATRHSLASRPSVPTTVPRGRGRAGRGRVHDVEGGAGAADEATPSGADQGQGQQLGSRGGGTSSGPTRAAYGATARSARGRHGGSGAVPGGNTAASSTRRRKRAGSAGSTAGAGGGPAASLSCPAGY